MVGLQTVLFTLLLALPALAQSDNGEGLAGETTDRVVTFFSLGVLLFFPLVALLFTWIEGILERRHEERQAIQARRRS